MTARTDVVWSMRDVVHRYEGAEQNTLDHITLEIRSGSMVALLGPNGSGKSTLLHTMLGTLRPTGGMVMFRNHPIGVYARRDIAKEIGVVPQGEIDPHFSVRDVVSMGRYPHLGPWQRERREDIEAVNSAMERADVLQFADRWIANLSGGERQRVRIARALAQQASVLVLDEPTTYLDIKHEMVTFGLLDTLRDEGVTVVVATHNLNLAARFADHVVLMQRGSIEAEGLVEQILVSEHLSSVYDWSISVETLANGARQVIPQ